MSFSTPIIPHRAFVREYVLGSWLTCVGMHVVRWHAKDHPTRDYITTFQGFLSRIQCIKIVVYIDIVVFEQSKMKVDVICYLFVTIGPQKAHN